MWLLLRGLCRGGRVSTKGNNGVTFPMRDGRNLSSPGGSNFLETHKVMNWKKFILLSCVVPCVFAVSTATAQMRGHRASTARMPMHRAPMLNSASGFQRRRDGDFDRDDRFRRFNRFNEIIVFDNFGFPFYYPYPYYPYPYGDYYSYGYGAYGYGVNGSMVAQVQRRLASAGYYSGPIDGVVGSGTRRAIRAYQRSHGLPIDGTIHRRLLATMGLA
jgi:Putative peptidoglycan binding domain